MTSESSAYFQQLTDKEMASKLNQLARSDGSVTVWEKGDKKREQHEAREYKAESSRLLCSTTSKSSLIGKKILFSFEINGLSFFGSGELKSVNSGLLALELSEKLFKSERRGTFRLLTFPHHKVFLHIELNEEELQQSNVIGIKSGVSETGLFKNFLSLIKGNDDGVYREGFTPFRVLDFSVTGAAAQVGELESKFFPKGSQTGTIVLEFNGKEEVIPNGEVVYNVDMLPSGSGQKTFKVGVKFLDIDTNMDQRLGKLINSALRDFETEFEDFLK